SARSSPAGSGFIPPLSQCLQLAVQECVSSKETTKGRSMQKLHVPRAIIRAARTTGIAFNGHPFGTPQLARFPGDVSIPLHASRSKPTIAATPMLSIVSMCIIERLAAENRSSVLILYHSSFAHCHRINDELRLTASLLLRGFGGHVL